VFRGTFDAAAEEVVADDTGHKALSLLLRRNLVEYEEKTGRYRLHDLARLYAAGRAGEDGPATAARHAVHYLNVLAKANALFLKGGANVLVGLALFDTDRENIEAGRAWAADRWKEEEVAARLASTYSGVGTNILDLRLTPKQRIGRLETALSAARELKDKAAEGVHLGNLGNAYAALGETRKAIEHYEQHLKIAREIGDRRGEGNALGNLGNAYAAVGETRKAIEYHEQALKIAREIGDRRGEGNALGNLGLAYAALGERRKAIEYHERAVKISRKIGDRRAEGQDLGNLGIAYKNLGGTRKAIN